MYRCIQFMRAKKRLCLFVVVVVVVLFSFCLFVFFFGGKGGIKRNKPSFCPSHIFSRSRLRSSATVSGFLTIINKLVSSANANSGPNIYNKSRKRRGPRIEP